MLTYLPGAPHTSPEVLVEVSARPTSRGYAGVPSAITGSYSALSEVPTGSALLFDLAGDTRFLVGTASALYEGTGSSFNDVSDTGGYSASTAAWRFATLGQTALAINLETQLQYSNSGAFATNANSPKAACMDTCEGFILLGDCDDTGAGLVNNDLGGAATGFGHQANRWWCSPFNSATAAWNPARSTQCTTGLLSGSPGGIKGVKRLGKNIVYFKEKAIHIGSYVQASEVWHFDEIPCESGCANQEAIVSTDTHLFFVGYDNFYKFDGNRPVRIGDGIREKFFGEQLNKAFRHLIHGQLDYQHSCIWWFYPSGGSEVRDSVVIYNYETGQWGGASFADLITSGTAHATPVQAVTGGITYADLGTLYSTYADLPDIPYGSPFWQNGAPVLACFDGDKVLRTLAGTSLTGSITTGWMGDENVVSCCTRIRPRWRTKPTTATWAHRTIMDQGETPTVHAATDLQSGRFDVLASARWHAGQMTMTGEWEIESLTPSLIPEGEE